MWNSPRTESGNGKRYQPVELSALIVPLDELLDSCGNRPVADIVEESILARMERNELLFLIYEVFEALLGDAGIPEGGHTGIQEAMVAELLSQAHGKICCEVELGGGGSFSREAVWTSVDRLLIHRYPNSPEMPWFLKDEGLKLTDPTPWLSEKLTLEVWQQVLLGDGGLWDEFLWDTDWRLDAIMDLPPDKANELTGNLGIELDVVQALPHTPNSAELKMAEHYISYLIWKDEVIHKREERFGDWEPPSF